MQPSRITLVQLSHYDQVIEIINIWDQIIMAFSGSFSGASAVAEKGKRWLKRTAQLLLCSLLSLVLLGCVNRSQSVRLLELPDVPSSGEVRPLTTGRKGAISEVAPPAIFLDLDEVMAQSAAGQPQIAIASPQPDQVLASTSLEAKIQLRGLSIYKDEKTGLGPHLRVILDNQPAQRVYSLEDPIEFSDLSPGSHTLRVLAVKPWGESFKNETAYAQTTFHVFTKTGENSPAPNQPALVYGEPQGSYGAEPLLLDFYLNNVPLHLIANDDPSVSDWKIRCDVNGQSFVIDQWQPMYLKGFKPGQNWVQLTLLDEQDNPIENVFNSTVRIVNYEPTQRDTLAKMTRGELLLKDVGQIADPNYEPPAEPIAPPELAAPSQPEQEKRREPIKPDDRIERNEKQEPETKAQSEEATPADLKSESTPNDDKLDLSEDDLVKTEPPESQAPLKLIEPETEALPTGELPETDELPETLVAPPEKATNGRFRRLRDFANSIRKSVTNDKNAQDLPIDAPAEFSAEPASGLEDKTVQTTEDQAIETAPPAIEKTSEEAAAEDKLTPSYEETIDKEVNENESPVPEDIEDIIDEPVLENELMPGADETTEDEITPAIKEALEEEALEEEGLENESTADAPGPFERLQLFWQNLKKSPSDPANRSITPEILDKSPDSLPAKSPLLVRELQPSSLDTLNQGESESGESEPDELESGEKDILESDELESGEKDVLEPGESEPETLEPDALNLNKLNLDNAFPKILTAPSTQNN